jgi:uncharacterized membrane protein YgcG
MRRSILLGFNAALLVAASPAALANPTPINLGADFNPVFHLVLPTSDGTEILMTAPGTLMPDAETSFGRVFAMARATGQATSIVALQADAGAAYQVGDSPDQMLASRDGRRVAVLVRTTHAFMSDGGDVIWLKDRVAGTYQLVTRRPDGEIPSEWNVDTRLDSMDASGRYVVFTSNATDLVPNDTNARPDVFLFDAQTKTVTRLNVSSTGEQLPKGGSMPAITPDGQFVAFATESPVLPEDTNNAYDWYQVDLAQHTVRLISKGPAGEATTGIWLTASRWSDDGRYFPFRFYNQQSFTADGSLASSVVWDRTNGSLISNGQFLDVPKDGTSNMAENADIGQISQSGRYVLVTSTVLLPPPYLKPPTNWGNLYLVDRQTKETVRVDMLDDGTQLPDRGSNETIIGDSARIYFRNTSLELGSDPRTVMYEWKPPTPSNLQVTIDGPKSNFPAGTSPQYTLHIANRGATTLNDIVFRRFTHQGVASAIEGTLCASICSVPPLAVGATYDMSFSVIPQSTTTDATRRVQFEVRVQSLSRFDQAPTDNKVAINAVEGKSGGSGSGSGSGGSGGGGGSTDFGAVLLLLAALSGRRGLDRRPAPLRPDVGRGQDRRVHP